MFIQHNVSNKWIGMMVALALAGMVTSVRGGSLDDPAEPTDPASAMYTAKDLYDRLVSGTNAPKRTGAFTEPTAGPMAGTMPTMDEIMAKAPATNAFGAVDSAVLSGKTFWGLTQGAWGTRTGTIATVTLSATTTNMAAGYYAATNLAQVNTNLAAGNIKSGANIFGVAGTLYAPVPKTGQTTSYAPRDDGALTNGVAWPNPRFTVGTSGDATNCVTDNLTGLMWARNANLASNSVFGTTGKVTWSNAFEVIANSSSGLVNRVSYGGYTDWRLPNVRELHSLIAWQYSSPALCNTAGTGHWVTNDPFVNVQLGGFEYWSSTTGADVIYACVMYVVDGSVYYGTKTFVYYVWPVRGGEN